VPKKRLNTQLEKIAKINGKLGNENPPRRIARPPWRNQKHSSTERRQLLTSQKISYGVN